MASHRKLKRLPNSIAIKLDELDFYIREKGSWKTLKSVQRRKWQKQLGPKLYKLVNEASLAGHWDVNGDNVMQNAAGQYKIIDLESFMPHSTAALER